MHTYKITTLFDGITETLIVRAKNQDAAITRFERMTNEYNARQYIVSVELIE